MNDLLVIDNLSFALRRSSKRKTIGITIDRGGELILSMPVNCPIQQIERIAREKSFWVYTKLAARELLFRPSTEKEFVSGEGFFYLGRSYRLLLITPSLAEASLPVLCLHGGRFVLRRDECYRAREHFVNWYVQNGRPWLQRRVELYANRIGVEPRTVEVRDLGFRWGSCRQGKKLNFHWRTILLPPRIIEYLVAHELVHLREPRHSAEFWKCLERAMPDFAMRKQWLAENGGRF